MAKFAVGDICEFIGPADHGAEKAPAGITVRIVSVGFGSQWHGYCEAYTRDYPSEQAYEVEWADGADGILPESSLRKLPPDSTHRDTTEDPGLTRLKKLLQQDKAPEKRKEKA